MARTVLTASEVPHSWAHGREARNSYNSISTDGTTLKSYDTVIARKYEHNGRKLCLIDTTPHSHSTQRHLSWAWRAIRGLGWNEIGIDFGTYRGRDALPYSMDEAVWQQVVEQVFEAVEEAGTKAIKARKNRLHHVNAGLELASRAEKVAEFIGLDIAERVEQARRGLREIPSYDAQALPRDPNKRRYTTNWEEAYAYVPNLPMLAARAFKKGENNLTIKLDGLTSIRGLKVTAGKLTARLSIANAPMALIKPCHGQVLTSLGVRMGIDQAKEYYFNMIASLRGEAVHSPQLPYGTLWRGPNSFVIGCHRFHITTIFSDFLSLLKAEGEFTWEDKL